MTTPNSLGAIAIDVRSGEMGIDAALSMAYALGYSAGREDRHELEANRIVRVGNGHKPEVQSDAN